MKKLVVLILLIAIILLTATACEYDLMGVDNLTIDENLYEEKQDYLTDNLQDETEEWGVLYEFKKDGLWGFKDAYDEVIIEPKYLYVHRFSEGLAFVRGVEGKESMTGFIDTTGQLVIPLPDAIQGGRFHEGFAAIIKREWDWANEDPLRTETLGPFIFIDRTGQNVFAQEFESVTPFSEGLARVVPYRGSMFFIDKTGQNAFGMEFAFASDFEDGYARVELLDGSRRYIDRHGNLIRSQP